MTRALKRSGKIDRSCRTSSSEKSAPLDGAAEATKPTIVPPSPTPNRRHLRHLRQTIVAGATAAAAMPCKPAADVADDDFSRSSFSSLEAPLSPTWVT